MPCVCLQRNMPCASHRQGNNKRWLKLDKPLTVDTSVEYKLDYSKFKGLDEDGNADVNEPLLLVAPRRNSNDAINIRKMAFDRSYNSSSTDRNYILERYLQEQNGWEERNLHERGSDVQHTRERSSYNYHRNSDEELSVNMPFHTPLNPYDYQRNPLKNSNEDDVPFRSPKCHGDSMSYQRLRAYEIRRQQRERRTSMKYGIVREGYAGVIPANNHAVKIEEYSSRAVNDRYGKAGAAYPCNASMIEEYFTQSIRHSNTNVEQEQRAPPNHNMSLPAIHTLIEKYRTSRTSIESLQQLDTRSHLSPSCHDTRIKNTPQTTKTCNGKC